MSFGTKCGKFKWRAVITNEKPGELMPDEIWVSTDGIYMYPSTGKKEHGSVRYTRAPQSPPSSMLRGWGLTRKHSIVLTI